MGFPYIRKNDWKVQGWIKVIQSNLFQLIPQAGRRPKWKGIGNKNEKNVQKSEAHMRSLHRTGFTGNMLWRNAGRKSTGSTKDG